MIRGGATLLAFCALTIQGIAPARGQTAVDVELVIAVDSSASIDEREFALQLAGIAAAFRDPEVVTAIGSGPRNRVAVMAIFWAESGYPSDTTPWHVLAGAADAEAFAGLMAGWPRRVEGGTGIGTAVLNSVKQLEYNAIQGKRRIIDISGDGRETTMREFFITSPQARAMAISRGITVNGLAILNDEPELDGYYRAQVTGGPGSFVMVARVIE
ncbi:MAG: DUF1194 domain-containing protein, partial [Proteobacteria bacterium]|nr:DUF1194 domain-containing protein [Pseudomonadota bacterium]